MTVLLRIVNELPTILLAVLALLNLDLGADGEELLTQVFEVVAGAVVWLHARRQLDGPVTIARR